MNFIKQDYRFRINRLLADTGIITDEIRIRRQIEEMIDLPKKAKNKNQVTTLVNNINNLIH